MSEPVDPVTAGLASVLKSLRTRAGLKQGRLMGTEISLDALAGLDSVKEFVAAGQSAQEAIVTAVSAAVERLKPTYGIVADVSLGLGLAADLIPGADLDAPDLGRRRAALLENWDRLHELRSAAPGQAPTLRTLRLEVETDAFNALASALTDADSRPTSSRPAPLLLDELRRIAGALRGALVLDSDGAGWPHDLRKGSKPVTALSSSYGIKAMLLLEGSLAADLIPVAEDLRRRASPDGGYAARTQLAPRPEVTATVLDTLHRLDGTADFQTRLAAMKNELGEFEKTRPFILTCLLEASVALGRDPGLTQSLIKDLLAARRTYGSLMLWPEKAEPDLADPMASIAHTARAVRALAKALAAQTATQLSGTSGIEVAEAVKAAAAWLAEQQDLNNVSEIIDRQVADRVEQVYVRHFTAAWVVKALVSAGWPASHPSVSAAVARIWNDYNTDAALWSWSNGDLPVWMTLDAVDALQSAALAATIQPVGFGVP